MKAAQKLVESNALPVNLRFACDGEEEVGGNTIVDGSATTTAARTPGIFDGGMLRIDVPAFEPRDARPDRVRRQGEDR